MKHCFHILSTKIQPGNTDRRERQGDQRSGDLLNSQMVTSARIPQTGQPTAVLPVPSVDSKHRSAAVPGKKKSQENAVYCRIFSV